MIYLIAYTYSVGVIMLLIVNLRLLIWLDGKYAEIVHDYEGLSVCVYACHSICLFIFIYVCMFVYLSSSCNCVCTYAYIIIP